MQLTRRRRAHGVVVATLLALVGLVTPVFGQARRARLGDESLVHQDRIAYHEAGIDSEISSNTSVIAVRFRRPPSVKDIENLQLTGLQIIDRLQNRTYYVRSGPNVDLLAALTGALVGPIVESAFLEDAKAKIEPRLRRDPPPFDARVPSSDAVRVTVAFHRGVSPGDIQQLASTYFARGQPYDPPLVFTAIVERSDLIPLATDPEIRWIRSAPFGFLPQIETARAQVGLTAAHADIVKPNETVDITLARAAVFECLPLNSDGGLSHSDLESWFPGACELGSERVSSAPVDVEPCDACSLDPPTTNQLDSLADHGEKVLGVLLGSGCRSQAFAETSPEDPGTCATVEEGGDTLWERCPAATWDAADARGVAPTAHALVYPANPAHGEARLKHAGDSAIVSNHSYVTAALAYSPFSTILDQGATGEFAAGATSEITGGHSPSSHAVVVPAGNYGRIARVVPDWCPGPGEDGYVSGDSNDCSGYYQLCNDSCSNARGYFSLYGVSKNAIVVGMTDTDEPGAPSHSVMSGVGPTLDGRLKPDLVAPGCRGKQIGYLALRLLGSNETDDGYVDGSTECGTSFSTAVVSGLALLLQNSLDVLTAKRLWPSTIKAALVHGTLDLTADSVSCTERSMDLECVYDTMQWSDDGDLTEGETYAVHEGPDFVTGFGLVQAEPSLSVVRDERYVESSLQRDTAEWVGTLNVPEQAERLRVTLAWDDPPTASGGLDDVLLNDLDLAVLSPVSSDSDTEIAPVELEYGPWILPPLLWDPVGIEHTCFATAVEDCVFEDLCGGAFASDYAGTETIASALLGTGITQPPPAIRCVRDGDRWYKAGDPTTTLVRACVEPGGTSVLRAITNPFTDEALTVQDNCTSDPLEIPGLSDVERETLATICHDRRNNVEQVEIEQPQPGTWAIKVRAPYALLSPTQDFSVVADFGIESESVPVTPEEVARTDTRSADCTVEFDDLGRITFPAECVRASTCRAMTDRDWQDRGFRFGRQDDCFHTDLEALCRHHNLAVLCSPPCVGDRCKPWTFELRQLPPEVTAVMIGPRGDVLGRGRGGIGRLWSRRPPPAGTRIVFLRSDPGARDKMRVKLRKGP